jgi:hypothetical protein
VGELHIEQTLQGILGMVQLRFGQELGVVRNIGDDEVDFSACSQVLRHFKGEIGWVSM